METLTGLCVLLAVLSRAVTGDTMTVKYFTDEGELTLEVRPPYSEPIINILWKFKGDLVAEWVKDKVPLELYNTFRGRTSLDTGTGLLTVRNMSKEDRGEYSVEINNKVHGERYEARWIKKVDKTEVVIQTSTCRWYSESCIVSCEADTNQAEPIKHSWKMGDGDWVELEKNIEITKTKNVHDEFITCQISNPLSEQDSEPIENLLYQKELGPGEIAMIVIGAVPPLLLLLLLLLLPPLLLWCCWRWCWRTKRVKLKKRDFKKAEPLPLTVTSSVVKNRNTSNTDPAPKATAPPPGDPSITSQETLPLTETSSDGKDTP